VCEWVLLRLLLADCAHKACWVVGLSERGHHLPLHKLSTDVTAGAVDALVVQSAHILSILHEESSLSQIAATYYRKKHTQPCLDDEVKLLWCVIYMYRTEMEWQCVCVCVCVYIQFKIKAVQSNFLFIKEY